MSIRHRLAFLFTGIVSVLLAIFCVLIYLFAEQHRQTIFRNRLRSEAMTAGHLLYGLDRVSPALYKLMDKNQLTVLPQEEIVIYDSTNQLVYESGTDHLTFSAATLKRVRQNKEVYEQNSERELVGVFFIENPTHYVIFASAVDTFGRESNHNLAVLLGMGWFVMTLLMLLAGGFLAGKVLQPINQINKRIDEINALHLSVRLPEGPNIDEFTQLAQRFNRMLNRLEESFRVQRAFISHASHELRTPLTAITGQLEVSLLANDDPDEMRATHRSVLDDVRGLNRLTNGLLALAKASMDASAVPMGAIQLDVLLKQVHLEVERLNPQYTIHLTIENDSNSANGWWIRGSEELLRIAFLNLMENGGKFSDTHSANVRLMKQGKQIELTVHNTGPAIPAEQLADIFIPFQRGRNSSGKPGHGIGLSLTDRIIQLHQGTIQVDSSPEKGTTFTITLPQ